MESTNNNQLESSNKKFSFFKRKKNKPIEYEISDIDRSNTLKERRSRYDMASVV